MIKQTRIAIALTGAGLLAAGAQAATITPVQAPPAGEASHLETLASIFGGVFVQNGNDFSNGVIDVTRVDDDLDQSYAFLSWEAHALANYSIANQTFGTVSDGPLFTEVGSGNNVSGSVVGVPGGNNIVFTRTGDNGTGADDVATDPSLNPGGRDHVVTYTWSVNGNPVSNQYLLFIEDLDENSPTADFDYNDFVVEVIGQPIPEPGSLALIAMGSLAMIRRRRG